MMFGIATAWLASSTFIFYLFFTLDTVLSYQLTSIFAGTNHVCVLVSDGNMKCFGNNDYGQLGLGDTNSRGADIGSMGDNLPFVNVTQSPGVFITNACLGAGISCVILSDNSTKCFGNNDFGQLGLGDTNSRGADMSGLGNNLPAIDFGSGNYAVDIVCGSAHMCGLLQNNKVICYGSNLADQLGTGQTQSQGDGASSVGDNANVTLLGSSISISSIYSSSCGGHTCIITNDQKAKCWGLNYFGQLGYGDTTSRGSDAALMGDNLLPIEFNTNRVPVKLSLASLSTCALLDDASIVCWGFNGGTFGIGSTANVGDGPNEMGSNLVPMNLGTGITATEIVVGYRHICGLINSGTFKCFGENSKGQLGVGDKVNRGGTSQTIGDNAPAVDLGTSLPVSKAVAGEDFTCVLINHFKVKCFGSNENGVLGLQNQDITTSIGDEPNEMGSFLPFVEIFSTPAPTTSPTPPTKSPTNAPTTKTPTRVPTVSPTYKPSKSPTVGPTLPTRNPTKAPTLPTSSPSKSPTIPTLSPTHTPTNSPTHSPSNKPTSAPATGSPTSKTPSLSPVTKNPSTAPTPKPTKQQKSHSQKAFASISLTSSIVLAAVTSVAAVATF